MNKADELIDRAADRLQEFANEAAGEGGLKAKIAEPLADDAALLRRMKPSLIRARIEGEAPTTSRGAWHGRAGRDKQLGERPKSPGGAGPNPFVVIGIAFATGIVLAKLIDWRGHAHPRD